MEFRSNADTLQNISYQHVGGITNGLWAVITFFSTVSFAPIWLCAFVDSD